MSDIVERLREKSEWTNQRPYFHAHDKCIEAAAEITRLQAELAEAQAAFANPVDLLDGLMLFKEWLDQVAPVPKLTRIWAHGSHFDIPILEAAFHAVGMEAPWFYRAPRDTRTIFDAAGVIDHSAYLTSFAQGDEVYHHALDDAIVQARGIATALRFLRR